MSPFTPDTSFEIYQFFLPVILPTAACVILYMLQKFTPYGKISRMTRNILCGTIFAALAILSMKLCVTDFGYNCSDACVISAGLFFGAPAGAIAGIISGIHRWFADGWFSSEFTRLPDVISIVFAGCFSEGLRRFLFEDKKSGPFLTLAIGIVTEIFHMTLVFMSNIQSPEDAVNFVGKATLPMTIANAASLTASAFILMLMSHKPVTERKKSRVRISQTIQRWLLVTVLLAFAATSYIVFDLQDTMAELQSDNLLSLALDETAADIHDASDQNLLDLAHEVAKYYNGSNIDELVAEYDIAELSFINKDGFITNSNVSRFQDFDMSSGEQSAEFLCLLGDTEEYVQEYGPISFDSTTMRKYAGVKMKDGFLQVGYDAEQFQKDIDERVVGITKNRHVGQEGYILIIDSEDQIISAPKNLTQEKLQQDASGIKRPVEGKTFKITLNDEECFCMYRLAEGYCIVSVLPASEALQLRNIALYVNTFLEILVFAVMFMLIYLLIKRVVVNQIKSINSSLAKITGGNLNEVVNVRTNEEFASLSDDINSTVDTLKRYINEATAKINEELVFARNIQTSALPNIFPAFPKRKDFDIYACMDTAKEVGGDFYDFYMTGTDMLHFLVADVSGKGIPAAMFMMRAKTELKSLTESELPINDVFTHGNAALCEGNDAGMFVTAWQGSIDLLTGLVRFANAGHNPPLVRHANGRFEFLRSRPGFVLAGMENVKYKAQELQLEPGDIIFLYTDGVTEATNSHNELYGEERLLAAVNSGAFSNVREMCEYIRTDVDAFVANAPQFDDITMLAFEFIGTPPAPSLSIEKASIGSIPEITEFIENELEKVDCPIKTKVQIDVAVDEICSNIINHGYEGREGMLTVRFIFKEEPRIACISFIDEGIPYNPLTKEDPDVTLSADERSIGGLGIFMVKKTMDDIKYKYENGQNVLTIIKRLGN